MKKNFSLRTSHFSLHIFHLSPPRGQTLIEALGALAIISVVISAIAISVITALSNAKFNQNQTLATKYAQQGTEIVRQVRNDNYASFKNLAGTYCLAKGQTGLGSAQGSCSTPNVDTFIRSVQIEQTPGCAANVAKVTVMVAFTDGKCANLSYCHKQTQITCLSTVNPIQAP